MKRENHINCHCSTGNRVLDGIPSLHDKSVSTSFVSNEYMSDWGHYRMSDDLLDSVRLSIENAVRKALYDEPVEDKAVLDEDDNMRIYGVRIKKTDEMTIDEFKENTRAYANVRLEINEEKYEQFRKDYGNYLFDCGNYHIDLDGYTIEFKEKGLRIIGKSGVIPYTWIDNVIGEYYIEP